MLTTALAPGLLWFGSLFSIRCALCRRFPSPPAARLHGLTRRGLHLPRDGERCIVANNVWNKNAAGHNFEQQVFEEDLNGKPALGWRWRSPWQMWPAIAAYPELICGNKPWDQPIGTYEGLPFHPGATRIIANYTSACKPRAPTTWPFRCGLFPPCRPRPRPSAAKS